MYYRHWKDNFGHECKNERPETRENIESYLTASIEFNGEKFLSLKDFAKVMGVSKYVAAKIINSGEIKDYGNTKITMLKIEDVKNYIKKLNNYERNKKFLQEQERNKHIHYLACDIAIKQY